MVKSAPAIHTLIARMDALGDPVRLRLLRLLERQELGVADLCDIVQMPQSSVSRHLKVLADNGWVHSRRDGTSNLYRMNDQFDAPARRLWQLARDQTAGWPTIEQDQLRLSRRLAQRKTASEAFFAGAAGEWDRTRRELYGEAFTSQATLALLPADWVVADLGCGTGQVVATLAPHVKQVIGVDFSDAMLRAARRRTAGLDNVDLRRGQLESLPISSETCNAALMVLVLTYVSDPAVVLSEMARILKPGGSAVIVDLLPHDREDFRRQMGQHSLGFAAGDLRRMLDHAGLSVGRIEPLTPEPAARGPALQLATATRQNPRT